MPRILIADDDPVSLLYMQAALERLGCEAVTVDGGTKALLVARDETFDLLLLDRRMPGLGGIDVLQALRQHGIRTPAIATSAELDADAVAQLRAAGFIDTLLKPATLEQIEGVVGRVHLVSSSSSSVMIDGDSPLLDDAGALAAMSGDMATLIALRGLLVQELKALNDELASAAFASPEQLSERLHRLRASCGFCGTPALAAAARRLELALRNDNGSTYGKSELSDFALACRNTLAALSDGA
jgi:CheY-like chemotaxis protein